MVPLPNISTVLSNAPIREVKPPIAPLTALELIRLFQNLFAVADKLFNLPSIEFAKFN